MGQSRGALSEALPYRAASASGEVGDFRGRLLRPRSRLDPRPFQAQRRDRLHRAGRRRTGATVHGFEAATRSTSTRCPISTLSAGLIGDADLSLALEANEVARRTPRRRGLRRRLAGAQADQDGRRLLAGEILAVRAWRRLGRGERRARGRRARWIKARGRRRKARRRRRVDRSGRARRRQPLVRRARRGAFAGQGDAAGVVGRSQCAGLGFDQGRGLGRRAPNSTWPPSGRATRPTSVSASTPATGRR